jgi:hypothetical protein
MTLPDSGRWLRIGRALVRLLRTPDTPSQQDVGASIAHGPQLPGAPPDPDAPPIVAPPDAPHLPDDGRTL